MDPVGESADDEETRAAQGRSALRHNFEGIAVAARGLAELRTAPARLRLVRVATENIVMGAHPLALMMSVAARAIWPENRAGRLGCTRWGR